MMIKDIINDNETMDSQDDQIIDDDRNELSVR
jgi:hypothetical protein